MARKSFIKLRALMIERESTPDDLARVLGMSVTSVRSRLAGATPWRPMEMLATLSFLGRAPEEVWIYFPPKDLEKCEGRKTA